MVKPAELEKISKDQCISEYQEVGLNSRGEINLSWWHLMGIIEIHLASVLTTTEI